MATFISNGRGGDWPEYMWIQTNATVNSQDIANNKSNVTLRVVGFYESSTGTYSPPNPLEGLQYLKIDGVNKIYRNFNPDFRGTSRTKPLLLMTWTGDLPHAADGSLKLRLQVYQDCPGVITLDDLYGDYTWTLPTIPRASVPTLSHTSRPLGSDITIYTNRKSTAFTHTLTYACGTESGTIATGVENARLWTIPDTLARAILTSTSGVVTITCKTYNGGALIGTKTVTFTATVPNTSVFKPKAGISSIVEGATGLSAFTVFIQGKSKLKITPTATGEYGATIKAISILVEGKRYTANPTTTDIIAGSGSIPVKVTVTDSRGLSGEYTQNVPVVAYAPPKITKFTAARSATAESTLTGLVGFSISPVSNQNNRRYIVRYRAAGTTTWTTPIDSTGYYSLIDQAYTRAGVLDPNLSYEAELVVSDSFTSTSKLLTIGTAFELMNFNPSGKGIAFGKVSEHDAIEIAMPLMVAGKLAHIVVETGSSGTQYWLKLGDGTMIIYGSVQVTIPEMAQLGSPAYVWGTTGIQAEGAPVTFPVPFVGSAPMLHVAMELGEELNTAVRSVSATTFTWRLYSYSQVATGSVKKLMYTAIGRWKA